MTFCCSPNCKNECGRQLTKEIVDAAEKWWGEPGAPIAISDFCDDEGNLKKIYRRDNDEPN
jgi:hypothetical protein